MLWTVFFFKQKTAYELRISDWSSDVCSSDLFRTQDLVDDVAVAGQQDQTTGILVEAADRENAFAMADKVDDVAGNVALGRAGDADRLVERDIDATRRMFGIARAAQNGRAAGGERVWRDVWIPEVGVSL